MAKPQCSTFERIGGGKKHDVFSADFYCSGGCIQYCQHAHNFGLSENPGNRSAQSLGHHSIRGDEYISSAGLRVLKKTYMAAVKKNGALELSHVNKLVMEVLEMTGFAGLLKIV